MKYTPQSLEQVARTILHSFGCNDDETAIVADHLVRANLAGHDSHGIGMLPMYGAQVKDGNLIPNQIPEFLQSNGAICLVDARKGFGHRMALLALDQAMQLASKHHCAVLGLRNAGHVSRLGNYAEYCAANGFVSLHFVNVWGHPPLVAPHASTQPGFSTNPISIGMPVRGEAKPMLDMATSTVAFGKIRVAHNNGEQVPSGWVLDIDGEDTNDPSPMSQHRQGALTAFGAHKGSGLGIFVELLAGALAGKETVASGTEIPNGVFNNMFSILVNPAGFDEVSEIEKRVMEFYDQIKSGRPVNGVNEVLMPGEPERHYSADRQLHGIHVDDETRAQLIETAKQFGVDTKALSQSFQAL